MSVNIKDVTLTRHDFFCLRRRHRRFTGLNEPPSVAAAPRHVYTRDDLSADSYEASDVFTA